MHPMLNIAVRAARKAGNLIAKNYETPDAVEASQKGSNDFVTNVDKAAEAVIIDTIRKSYPQHTIITEESGELEGTDPGCSMGYRSTGWHYQLYQTSAALRGIYRRSYQRPH